jgi:hypothetical protein
MRIYSDEWYYETIVLTMSNQINHVTRTVILDAYSGRNEEDLWSKKVVELVSNKIDINVKKKSRTRGRILFRGMCIGTPDTRKSDNNVI